MSESVELYDAEEDVLVVVQLSKEDAARARRDVRFAQKLLKEELCRERSLQYPVEMDLTGYWTGDETSEAEVTAGGSFIEPPEEPYWTGEGTSRAEVVMAEGNNSQPPENEVSLYRWSPPCVKLLLELYKNREELLHSGRMPQKKVWQEISNEINSKGYITTGPQCSGKLRSLKKTYKSIKDHNKKSGNDRRTWAFFEIMEDIFGKKAWCEPVAVASSSGMSVKKLSEQPPQEETTESDSGCSSTKKVSIQSLLLRRLNQKEIYEGRKEKRHKERMEMDKKFLDVLEKLANK